MTYAAKTANRLSRVHRPRPMVSAALLADLSHRITARDRALLQTVWEHRVLTTDQLTAIFFPSLRRTRQRLLELYGLAALDRFRPWTPNGTEPLHWVLGPGGAHVLAAERGIDVAELGYRADKTMAISLSRKLGHHVGVNDFFARLHACARQQAAGRAAVAEWWPERRCAKLWGDLASPDAFGRWTETCANGSSAELDFFLEHDTGSEALGLVAAKLHGYAALAESTGITTPVLFWLPSAAREANLRKLLNQTTVPVATAVHTPPADPDGPAGAVWLPVGVTGPRRRLATLPDVWRRSDPGDVT